MEDDNVILSLKGVWTTVPLLEEKIQGLKLALRNLEDGYGYGDDEYNGSDVSDETTSEK